MIIGIFSEAHIQLCAIILLCFGYFNYFLIVEPINVFFKLSSLTGQILVDKFLIVCNWIIDVFNIVYSFCQILYEDSIIFLKDAIEKVIFLVYIIKEFYSFLEKIGWNTLNFFFEIGAVISNTLEFLYYTIVGIKEGIQFIGTVIWRAFTTLPETATLIIHEVNDFIKNTLNELTNFVFKLQEKVIQNFEKLFLFEIPIDSVCGLIIGAVLFTILCVKFKEVSFLLSSAFISLCQKTASFCAALWSGRFLEHRRNNINNEDDERLCIICQYQLKEVIIFPCKHLCLCTDCSGQLIKTKPVCPICRSNISGTLKIYV